jgi:hypothetical protein
MRRNTIGLVVALGLLALLAGNAGSIMSGLRHALSLARRRPYDDAAERRERVRRALAPITVRLDRKAWESKFGRLPDKFDLAAFRASMPVLDPPLSQTIIDERESHDY